MTRYRYPVKEKIEIVCEYGSFVIGRVKKGKLNQAVVDERGRIVGRVVSIFGPTELPYVKIKIQRRRGQKLYLGGEKKWQRRKIRGNG